MNDITQKLIPSYLDRSYCDELQFYHPENCIFNTINGEWTVIAERTAVNGKPQFFSGMLLSINNKKEGIIFSGQKGEIQMRARFDNLKGAFPAAWLLPFKGEKGLIAEIDIFEWISQDPNILHLTNHWGKDYGSDDHKKRGRKIRGYWNGYHTYKLKWSKYFMWWIIDGRIRKVAYNRYRNNKFYLLINLAIGGWAENPNPNQNRITMNVKDIRASDYVPL